MSSTMSRRDIFPFMSLPSELRLNCYDLIINDKSALTLLSPGCESVGHTSALIQAGRETRREFMHHAIFNQSAKIVVDVMNFDFEHLINFFERQDRLAKTMTNNAFGGTVCIRLFFAHSHVSWKALCSWLDYIQTHDESWNFRYFAYCDEDEIIERLDELEESSKAAGRWTDPQRSLIAASLMRRYSEGPKSISQILHDD